MNMDDVEEKAIVHAIRLMGDELVWKVLCSETIPTSDQNVINSTRIEKITCPKCLEIANARLEYIREVVMPRIMEIPWVEEAISDGVFEPN